MNRLTQSLVYPLVAIAALVLSAGCGTKTLPPGRGATEASLAEQIAAVERGESTRIEIAETVLGDTDAAVIGKAVDLKELLVDHPESRFSVAGIASLAALPDLEHLRIRGPGIDNACLAELAHCENLRILNVPQGSFDDDGLAALAELPELVQLRFGSSAVTDRGMQMLDGFPALVRLHLIDVPITDAGLMELAKIEQLQSLYIDGGNITDAGWDELFRLRPKLHVHVNQQHHDRDPHKHPH
jgi:hypothetical protein